MSLQFFWIPAMHPEQAQAELNRFLTGHRVLTVERQFVQQGSSSGWAIVVDYVDGSQAGSSMGAVTGRPKVDYQAVLEPQAFAVFTALRNKRKVLAERARCLAACPLGASSVKDVTPKASRGQSFAEAA